MAGTVDNWLNTLIPIELGGTCIECCHQGCKKWRCCTDYKDLVDVPEKWYCDMNSDESINNCSVPEFENIGEHEVFVLSRYKAGSLVWAKARGHPWRPAMVDFCPETECYYLLDGNATEPTQYHVRFLNEDIEQRTRAWIKSGSLKPFARNQDPSFALNARIRGNKVSAEEEAAILEGCEIATQALRMLLFKRLAKFNFISWRIAKRFSSLLETPGIVTKPEPLALLPKKERRAAMFRNDEFVGIKCPLRRKQQSSRDAKSLRLKKHHNISSRIAQRFANLLKTTPGIVNKPVPFALLSYKECVAAMSTNGRGSPAMENIQSSLNSSLSEYSMILRMSSDEEVDTPSAGRGSPGIENSQNSTSSEYSMTLKMSSDED